MRVHLRLVATALRARWRPALVLLCCLAVAATTLALGVVLREQADRPWDRTFAAANGAHVVASSGDRAVLRDLAARPEVAEATGPLDETFGTLGVAGSVLLARLVEAPPAGEGVDRPLLVAGASVRPGGVVVEATMARTLGLRVGDLVELGPAASRPPGLPAVSRGPRTPLRVVGIAVVASQAPFPATQPGLILVDGGDLASLVRGEPVGGIVLLRLHDAARADDFVTTALDRGQVLMGTWRDRRDQAVGEVAEQRVVVLTFALLLVFAAAATAAVLASARAVAGTREAALLRAVGVTPRGAIGVAVAENAALAGVASVLGWLIAQPVAHSIVSRAAVALSTPPGAGPRVAVLGLVAAVLVPVVSVATAVPLLRGGRVPSVVALAGGAAARSYGTSRLAAWADTRLPYVVALGVRAAAGRPPRQFLAGATVALAVAAGVAAVGMDATLDREAIGATAAPAGFVAATAPDLLRPVAYSLMGLLAATALAGVVATTLAAAAESRRDDALLRAAGASARQLVARTVCGTAFTAGAGALLGVPLGVAMFRGAYALANGSTHGAVLPAAWEYASVAVVATTLTVAAAAVVAAAATRVRPAEALRQV